MAFEADVTDLQSLQRAVAATVERFGRIDVAIANAGISFTDALAERDHPWAAGMRRLENVVRAAVSADRVPGLRGPEGRIDFENERAIYSQGDSDWKLFAPGSRYIGKPGEWYAGRPDGLYGMIRSGYSRSWKAPTKARSNTVIQSIMSRRLIDSAKRDAMAC